MNSFILESVQRLYRRYLYAGKSGMTALIALGARIRVHADARNIKAGSVVAELLQANDAFKRSTLFLGVQASEAFDVCHGVQNFPVNDVRRYFSLIKKGDARVIDALNSGMLPEATKKEGKPLSEERAVGMLFKVLTERGETGFRKAYDTAYAEYQKVPTDICFPVGEDDTDDEEVLARAENE